jgi:uncharacterized circularly permuted ATP-grasp superfamily protein/uncharacterized alpha-E superfamily protein
MFVLPSRPDERTAMDLALPPTYAPPAGRYDELLDDRGNVREPWARLVRRLSDLGATALEDRRRRADRLLEAEGASHVVHDDGTDASRPWRIDPVPIVMNGREWAALEEGLVQRARLLDALLDDLYGPRRVLLDGVVPAELVLGSRRFRAAGHGVVPAAGRRLVVYGADVVRRADGRLLVIADHTDAPSGAGYAVLNRTVLTRLFPETYRDLGVRGLGDYFSGLRAALSAAAPEDRVNARVVVLTPGIGHPSYFEHSYLATYLGYNLAEGADLAVRDGRVWLRALGGLESVDALLRRTEEAEADPLELEHDSVAGVPGLVEAAREHGVTVANALGSAIAAHIGLQAYLPALCTYLLGEDLRLGSLPTLWCGDPEQRAIVLDRLGEMVLHDTDPVMGVPSAFGHDLTDAEAAAWRSRIERTPHRYVGQEKVALATTPLLRGGLLEPGTAVFRAQAVAGPDRYRVLPGGLGRVVDAMRPVLDQTTGLSKDVWVLADAPPRAPLRRSLDPELPQIDLRSSLPSRAAEALFWLGRNSERAEAVARMARAVVTRVDTEPGLLAVEAWCRGWRAMLRAVSGGAPRAGLPIEPASMPAEVEAALSARPGSLTASLGHLHRCARSVREFVSGTTWRVLGMLEAERIALDRGLIGTSNYSVVESLDRVLVATSALAGLANDATVRGPAWRFLDIGRRLERALLLLGIVEAGLVEPMSPDGAQPLLETVLTATESLVEYRRRHRSDLALDAVLDLLLVDDANPRSLAFQLDRLYEDAAALPAGARRDDHMALVEESARALLDVSTVPLARLVLDTRGPLLALVDGITTRWFGDDGYAGRFRRGAG